MKHTMPIDLISTFEAQQLLGVSRPKMSRLLKEGQIRHFPNPIDKRVKLVSRAEVLALKPPRLKAA
ncbi:MAG: helix-turn-helix domain-containing protein [Acidobacteriota bacterium]|nr:helix-turn-helix domain-containing protein [Acidobacteriota bacterium]